MSTFEKVLRFEQLGSRVMPSATPIAIDTPDHLAAAVAPAVPEHKHEHHQTQNTTQGHETVSPEEFEELAHAVSEHIAEEHAAHKHEAGETEIENFEAPEDAHEGIEAEHSEAIEAREAKEEIVEHELALEQEELTSAIDAVFGDETLNFSAKENFDWISLEFGSRDHEAESKVNEQTEPSENETTEIPETIGKQTGERVDYSLPGITSSNESSDKYVPETQQALVNDLEPSSEAIKAGAFVALSVPTPFGRAAAKSLRENRDESKLPLRKKAS